MKRTTLLQAIVFCLVLVLATQGLAQQPRRGGLYGDWLVKSEYNGRTMESILAFSRDAEDNRTGQWISLWGVSDLQDITFDEGQLSFKRVRENREGQTITSTFKGTIADGKLSGTMSGGQREYTLAGARAPRMSRAVGSWRMKVIWDGEEHNPTFIIKTDEEGTLTGQWKSEQGEPKISDVTYNRGELTFKMTGGDPGSEWEASFKGTIQRDALAGTFTSEMGELEFEGARMGTEMIGTWNLEVTSERGTRKQRLRINPDMSALYGALAIEKIDVDAGQMAFKTTLTFGDRQFEIGFEGKLQDAKMVGELTTSMGTQKITGTKVVRRRRPSR